MISQRDPVDQHFLDTVRAHSPTTRNLSVDANTLLTLFDSQVGSRHLDFIARELGKQGLGFYSIGSAGHESNATVAVGVRPTDPALLHYRSGAFYIQRANQIPGSEPLLDVLHGIVASTSDPISGGRHKVFGNQKLSVVPQTSTIASHLPRAVGLAFALTRIKQLGLGGPWPDDAIVVCSFGDASANHSTAVGAINSALHASYQGLSMPILFICEDNGIGISVPTPSQWIAHSYANRLGLEYFAADGHDPISSLNVSQQAAEYVRVHRIPAFLHLRTVRFMGHAGSDVESGYRSRTEVIRDYDRDPLLGTARTLIDSGALAPDDVIDLYETKREEVTNAAKQVLDYPKLSSTHEVTRAIAVDEPDKVLNYVLKSGATVHNSSDDGYTRSASVFLTVAQSINQALSDALRYNHKTLVFGEDIARKGGVYGVTRGLRKQFGGRRVFDTLLDEQSVLGTALGSGLAGLLPIPEIQYLAYVHNALDQIRGEASTLSFFSNTQYDNPMVVRLPSYAYQKGFGGHFHNDNSVAALLDIPGLVVASPSTPDDAAAMMHTCVAAATVNRRVCLFIEPIALYHTRDLVEADDNKWLAPYPDMTESSEHVPIGSGRIHRYGHQLTLITFGNGVPMSLRVVQRLAEQEIQVQVLDIRWLAPLPVRDILAAANATGKVLIVDETRRTGAVSERIITTLIDHGFTGRIERVCSEDSFIPLGPGTQHVLLNEDTIESAALRMSLENSSS